MSERGSTRTTRTARCSSSIRKTSRYSPRRAPRKPSSSSWSGLETRHGSWLSGPLMNSKIAQLAFSGTPLGGPAWSCLLYTSDAADDLLCVDLGGRRIIKKKKKQQNNKNTDE